MRSDGTQTCYDAGTQKALLSCAMEGRGGTSTTAMKDVDLDVDVEGGKRQAGAEDSPADATANASLAGTTSAARASSSSSGVMSPPIFDRAAEVGRTIVAHIEGTVRWDDGQGGSRQDSCGPWSFFKTNRIHGLEACGQYLCPRPSYRPHGIFQVSRITCPLDAKRMFSHDVSEM